MHDSIACSMLENSVEIATLKLEKNIYLNQVCQINYLYRFNGKRLQKMKQTKHRSLLGSNCIVLVIMKLFNKTVDLEIHPLDVL